MHAESIHRSARVAPKPRAHRLEHGDRRLVVRSIGRAGVGLVRSLRRVLPLPEGDIAALILQAPSELIVGLDDARAEAISGFLAEQGLDCAVIGPGAPLAPGAGDHDVALSVDDPARLAGVAVAVVELLGVGLEAARELLCATPAVLLGGVSAATVEALRARFAPLGATVDASRPAEARFDLFVAGGDPSRRAQVQTRLAAFGAEATEGDAVVALGLDHPSAARAWHAVRTLGVPACCVDRAFARYDVRLHRAQDGEALRAWLTGRLGVPAAVVPRLLSRLPIGLMSGVPHAEAEAALAELAELGGVALAEPLALQTFALNLAPAADSRADMPAAVAAIKAIGGLAEDAAVAAATTRRVPGPLSSTRARWLRHELRRAGFDARMELA